MPEIPKLSPEVEVPRPRSSGAAVVAVAALAMFTAVGASAFVVRMRMSPCPTGMRWTEAQAVRVASERNRAVQLRDDFLTAAAQLDDRTALELYRSLPPGSDPAGHLAAVRETILARQMALVERELARGDCDALRERVSWLRRVAPDEGIEVRAAECRRPHILEVELVRPPRAKR